MSNTNSVTPEQKNNEVPKVETQHSSRPTSAKLLVVRRFICFLKLFGTRNYYKGIDKPSLWQWAYTFRLGYKTSWEIACEIWS